MLKIKPIVDGKALTVDHLKNEVEELRSGALIAELSDDAYHDGPGYGSGKLLAAATKSVAHMRIPVERTDAMLFGSLVHTLVLEPEAYSEKYCVRPPGTAKNTKAGKAAYLAWEAAEKAHRLEIKADLRDEARAIANAVLSHPVAGRLLAAATHRELSAYVDIDGLLCHARLDAYDQRKGVIYDLKTCQDARPEAFSKTLANYALQAAMYSKIMYMLSDHTVAHDFVIIAVEKAAPYGVRLYQVGANTLQYGRDLLERGIHAIKEAQSDIYNNLPYIAVPTVLEAPGWLLAREQNNNGDYDNDYTSAW